MNLHTNKWIQYGVIALYPAVAFGLLFFGEYLLRSWMIPVLAVLLFCFLWRGMRQVLWSNLLLWVAALPIWLFSLEAGGGEQMMANLAFIIMMFLPVLLIPQLLIVDIRNRIYDKFVRKQA
ncbi:hypothetical protein [Paenibacillus paeoniae]|uniref:Uncharacterized protein n=1 Tax=Paenibacillus paeoniae TaxID=2292705 RepID=A0A371PEP2_9BACL|nr:hypothetical protein [Paenibacillus paeoniae]REK74397.1 hypothetical protein DX130_17930 [Paenibacillus paeoniae]